MLRFVCWRRTGCIPACDCHVLLHTPCCGYLCCVLETERKSCLFAMLSNLTTPSHLLRHIPHLAASTNGHAVCFEQVSALTCLPWCAGQGTDPSKTNPAPPVGKEDWRQPVPIDMKFGVGMKMRPRHNRPATASLWGRLIFVVYIGSFLFYAYCRVAHTMDKHNSAFAYQVCRVLVM